MSVARLRIEDVRDALRAEDVIDAYGLNAQRHRAKYRLAECPRCHARSSSRAISIDGDKRTWGHYGHGRNEGGDCYGDLIDLVAACEGLPRRHRDWPTVLARAADIAGVSASTITDADRERRCAEKVARERARAADEARMERERRIRAARDWSQAQRRHDDGENYLRGRGVDPRLLIQRECLKFSASGDICVPLHSLEDGALVTVHRRLIAPTDPGRKCHTPEGGTTRGTLCGRVSDINDSDTVVTEGVVDTLTAVLLWTDANVLGAAGAGQLHTIVAIAAARVRNAGGRLVIVPDGDDVGVRCAARAVAAARDAGLVLDRDLIIVDLGEHHDLNDAHRAGWKRNR